MERAAEEGSGEHAAGDAGSPAPAHRWTACQENYTHTHTHARTHARTRAPIGALTPPCRQREEMGLNERRKSGKRS